MRVYLQKYESLDVDSYISFLEEVFKTSFKRDLSEETSSRYCLKSSNYKRYLLIRGENTFVYNLLHQVSVVEKNILIMSCHVYRYVSVFKLEKPYALNSNKHIYIPLGTNDNCTLDKYNGNLYGLKFDPCLIELKMLRDDNKDNFYETIDKYFIKKSVKEILDNE